MEKIKLVVLNEYVLGYILPELKDYVQILHSSILKGSPYPFYGHILIGSKFDKIRLASEADFNDYRCVFSGYNTEEFEYQIN